MHFHKGCGGHSQSALRRDSGAPLPGQLVLSGKIQGRKRRAMARVVVYLQSLDWVINFTKSHLQPLQDLMYLGGAQFQTAAVRVSLPENQLRTLQGQSQRFWSMKLLLVWHCLQVLVPWWKPSSSCHGRKPICANCREHYCKGGWCSAIRCYGCCLAQEVSGGPSNDGCSWTVSEQECPWRHHNGSH